MAQQQTNEHGAPPSKDIDFRALIECSSDIIMQFSRELQLVYVSPSVTDVLGWTPSDVYRNYFDIISDEDRDSLFASGQRLASGERGSDRITFRVARKSGEMAWVEGASHVLQQNGHSFDGIVVTLRDISIQKDLEAKLEDLARTDGLTGLANRRTFDETLTREWAIARREINPLSLIMADLDHFKDMNDRYGHQAGDECLQTIAQLFRTTARRPADLVARYGGEEFALILPNTHTEGALTLAAYLQKALEDMNIPNEGNGNHGRRMTASFGIATVKWPEDRKALDRQRNHHDLLKAADTALYSAKSSGRNRCCSTLVHMTSIS
ncbi:GGDEF domain-containing protein [Roseibium sp.]|uniref:GGDEF domain-containing protein n=1 Tax=Roseibium sp. TaxID=1936156 RepID=UPI003A972EE6